MAAGCTFTVNRARYKQALEHANASALNALREQALADCNEYVKVDQNTLRESGKAEVTGQDLKLSYNTPYAKRQYFTGRPSHDENPRAALMWMHVAQRVNGAEWLKILKKAFAGRLG